MIADRWEGIMERGQVYRDLLVAQLLWYFRSESLSTYREELIGED